MLPHFISPPPAAPYSVALATLLSLWENIHYSTLVTELVVVEQIKPKGENSWNPSAPASGLTAITPVN